MIAHSSRIRDWAYHFWLVQEDGETEYAFFNIFISIFRICTMLLLLVAARPNLNQKW